MAGSTSQNRALATRKNDKSGPQIGPQIGPSTRIPGIHQLLANGSVPRRGCSCFISRSWIETSAALAHTAPTSDLWRQIARRENRTSG